MVHSSHMERREAWSASPGVFLCIKGVLMQQSFLFNAGSLIVAKDATQQNVQLLVLVTLLGQGIGLRVFLPRWGKGEAGAEL